MIIVNNPQDELIDVKCYQCGAEFKVHPVQNSESPFIKECELHNKKKENE